MLKNIKFEYLALVLNKLTMASNKHVLAGKLSKRTLTLEEKIKLLDYKKKNPTVGVRSIADQFNIGKTAAASILKNGERIRQRHEQFHEKSKRVRLFF